jgi:hypothetical protein
MCGDTLVYWHKDAEALMKLRKYLTTSTKSGQVDFLLSVNWRSQQFDKLC